MTGLETILRCQLALHKGWMTYHRDGGVSPSTDDEMRWCFEAVGSPSVFDADDDIVDVYYELSQNGVELEELGVLVGAFIFTHKLAGLG